jgi:pimeloyl-ACP methyl ester carboxylesterase
MTSITYTERGAGRTYLLLHGGGGPQTVAVFADLLAEKQGVRVITPVHPGFSGTDRPREFDSARALAFAYRNFLDELDLEHVTVIGNSLGGWIAAELAVLGSPRIDRVILVDAVGVEVPGSTTVDFFSLGLADIADYSFFDPDKFRIDPATLPPAALAAMPGNRAALAVYGGERMSDPTLEARLAAVSVPTLVIWGEADRIADVDHGRAFAAAVPGARFELMPETGHLPQVETPERLLHIVATF